MHEDPRNFLYGVTAENMYFVLLLWRLGRPATQIPRAFLRKIYDELFHTLSILKQPSQPPAILQASTAVLD